MVSPTLRTWTMTSSKNVGFSDIRSGPLPRRASLNINVAPRDSTQCKRRRDNAVDICGGNRSRGPYFNRGCWRQLVGRRAAVSGAFFLKLSGLGASSASVNLHRKQIASASGPQPTINVAAVNPARWPVTRWTRPAAMCSRSPRGGPPINQKWYW